MVCSQALPYYNDAEELNNKFAGRLLFYHVSSLLKFTSSGIVQQLLHEIKYRRNPELAIFMGKEMGKPVKPFFAESPIDMIIPVPLHPSKQRIRGYNQSEKLADGLGEIILVPVVPSVLTRIQKSETQTKKSREERWKNVADIFKVVDAKAIKDKHILLIDDVITTGATAEACGQSLLAAGAGQLSFAFMASA